MNNVFNAFARAVFLANFVEFIAHGCLVGFFARHPRATKATNKR